MSRTFYAIPNMQAEAVREQRGMRVHAWRGIGAGYNKFAAESFLDEVAHATGKDPLALRLELTKDHPRANAVIKAVAEMADWKKQAAEGRGAGHRVLRLSRDVHAPASPRCRSIARPARSRCTTTGSRSTPGLVIQPENAHAQLESAVVYGLAAALLRGADVQGRRGRSRPTSTTTRCCA